MTVLKEKNLREIYKSSKVIPLTKFNIFFPLIFSACVIAVLLATNQNILSTFKKIEDFTNFIFSPFLSILGFLVAGYAIFCTITPLELQIKMSDHNDKKTGLPFFKKVHFTFIRVFIYFIAFNFLLLIIFLFKGIQFNTELLSKEQLYCIYLAFNYAIIFILVYGSTFLFCELSSFIFNIYHSIATTLMWEKDIKNRKPPQ